MYLYPVLRGVIVAHIQIVLGAIPKLLKVIETSEINKNTDLMEEKSCLSELFVKNFNLPNLFIISSSDNNF